MPPAQLRGPGAGDSGAGSTKACRPASSGAPTARSPPTSRATAACSRTTWSTRSCSASLATADARFDSSPGQWSVQRSVMGRSAGRPIIPSGFARTGKQPVDDAEAQTETGQDQEGRQQHHGIGPVEAREKRLRRIVECILPDQRQEDPIAEYHHQDAEDQAFEPAPSPREPIVNEGEDDSPKPTPEDAVDDQRQPREGAVLDGLQIPRHAP